MFIADKLIYIHLQKTGGTRIREVLAQFTDGHSEGRSHGYLDKRPTDKVVVGSIRNPLDWYVSLWAFGCAGKGGVLSWLKDDEEWQAVYSDSSDPVLFQQWLKMVYSLKYVNQMGNGYDKFCLNEQVGLMTWRFAYLYTENISTDSSPDFINYDQFRAYLNNYDMTSAFIEAENMAFTMWNALRVAGYDIKYVNLVSPCEQKTNQSKHRAIMEYHTPETIELIKDKERYIFERFGYGNHR